MTASAPDTAATATWDADVRALADRLRGIADAADPGRAMIALSDLTDNSSAGSALMVLRGARRKAAQAAVDAAGSKAAAARALDVPVLRVFRALATEPRSRSSVKRAGEPAA